MDAAGAGVPASACRWIARRATLSVQRRLRHVDGGELSLGRLSLSSQCVEEFQAFDDADTLILSSDRVEDDDIMTVYISAPFSGRRWKGLAAYMYAQPVARLRMTPDAHLLFQHPLVSYRASPSGSSSVCGLDINFSYPFPGCLILHFTVDPRYISPSFSSAMYDGVVRERVGRGLSVMLNPLLARLYPQHAHSLLSVPTHTEDTVLGREQFEPFFDRIRNLRLQRKPTNYTLSSRGLSSRLRPYQTEAVQWMMERELLSPSLAGKDLECVALSDTLFYFPYYGLFTASRNVELLPVKGGILAEEMGLGKTVEILSLIVSLGPLSKPMEERDGKRGEEDNGVEECVDALISQVVAAEDNDRTLMAMDAWSDAKKTSRSATYKRPSISEEAGGRGMGGASEPLLRCECGESFTRAQVHWTHDLDDSQFVCPHCIRDKSEESPVSVGCTLIVVPAAIIHQWYDEIKRHVRDEFMIDLYAGVACDGYKHEHPYYLRRFQIVLCTYDILRKELPFVTATGNQRGGDRVAKKRSHVYGVMPSPLTAIHWWRVCLDESQMVESASSITSQMASLLPSRARWAITGTPLQKSVADVFGLLSFLVVEPYFIPAVWQKLVWRAYTHGETRLLEGVVSGVLWRNERRHVISQLSLPRRTERVVRLTLSAMEERKYRRVLAQCRDTILGILGAHAGDALLSELPTHVFARIMSALNQLRLIIVTMRDRPLTKAALAVSEPFSPHAMYMKLHNDAKTQLEESQRTLFANRNALAGLHWLYGSEETALEWYNKGAAMMRETRELNELLALTGSLFHSKYDNEEDCADDKGEDEEESGAGGAREARARRRELMKLQQEKRKFHRAIKVDSVQIMHLAKNVEELVAVCPSAAGLWERVREDGQAARAHYVHEAIALYKRASADVEKRSKESLEKLPVVSEEEVGRVLSGIVECGRRDRLAMAIRQGHHCNRLPIWQKQTLLLERVPLEAAAGWRGVEDMWRELHRQALHMPLPRSVRAQPGGAKVEEQFQKMMDCPHNERLIDGVDPRSIPDPEHPCALCLFNKKREQFDRELQRCPTGPLPPVCFMPVRELLSCLSSCCEGVGGAVVGGVGAMGSVVEWMDGRREEREDMGRYAIAVQEVISRFREVRQCEVRYQDGMRIELARSGQPLQSRLSLSPRKAPMAIACYERAEQDLVSERQRAVAGIRYLQTLNEQKIGPEECPVCLCDMWGKRMVFPCAHSVCEECFRQMAAQPHRPAFNLGKLWLHCPKCRARCGQESVCVVDDRKGVKKEPGEEQQEMEQETETEQQAIDKRLAQLNLPVKLDGVVRCLLELCGRGEKVLLFSSIHSATIYLHHALQRALVPFVALKHPSDYHTLALFKTDPQVKVLVMHADVGAKGLNLTEANHVVFLEPLVELDVQAQAIGRIERFGQQRAMTVHHFVVEGTVEEEIYAVGRGERGWTVAAMRDMFMSAL